MVATTGSSSADPLFQPWSIGDIELKHRIVLAPLTRVRADENTLDPNDMMVEYYEQRASDGGLLITEATYPFKEAGGIPTAPGCFTEEQIAGWKKINNAIHAKGGKVFVQFWILGRANPGQSDVEVISSSAIPIPTKEGEPAKPTPRALTTEEVQQFVKKFAEGCKKAVEAGFDGVEIHGAHGYLVDQFFQNSSNTRTDQYGGSVENRARFGLELIEASSAAIGQEKLGIRLSPYGHFQGSLGGQLEVFTYLINEITSRFPNFGYIHMVESRGDPSKLNNWEAVSGDSEAHETLDRFREIVKGGKGKTEFLSAGGYSPETARETVEKYGGGVVFGRIFISNPDLPERIKHGYPLAKYDRPTFYSRGPKGYTDYPQWSQAPTQTSTD